MFLRHFLIYLFARGVSGVLNFAALALYTRLLSVEDYGIYSLVISVAGLVHVVFFQTLQFILERFLPAHLNEPKSVLQPVAAIFLMLVAVVFTVAFVYSLTGVTKEWLGLIWLSTIFLIAHAWHELNLGLIKVRLQPQYYGLLGGMKALVAVLAGGVLAWAGFGASAPIIGLVVGAVLSWSLFGRKYWRGVHPTWPESPILRQYGAYGVPLALTFLLGWVISSSDRMIIALLLNEVATGVYSVGYDLAQQSLGLLLVIINTAATPLAIRALEKEGVSAAKEQMRQNGEMMFVMAMSGAAGLIAIGPDFIAIFVGGEYRSGALTVFPWIAASAAVMGVKAFYFDIAFHLAKRSLWLVITSCFAAVVNVVGNFVLIPQYGIVGAAMATFGALLIAVIFSAAWGRSVFPMPSMIPMLFKGAIAAIVTNVVAGSIVAVVPSVFLRIFLAITCSIIAIAIVSIFLNVSDCREKLVVLLSRR